MTQQGRAMAGRILLASAGVALLGGVLLFAGVLPVSRPASLVAGGVLLAVGIVDGLLGLVLMKREER